MVAKVDALLLRVWVRLLVEEKGDCAAVVGVIVAGIGLVCALARIKGKG